MKIGVVSDTHIPRRAEKLPEKVLEVFSSVDMILHAGDLTDISVIDELKQSTGRVEAVLGNMDPPQNQLHLPIKKIIEAEGKRIVLIHGRGGPGGLKERIWNDVKKDQPDIVVFGHSHQAEKTFLSEVLFLNPGSPTDKVFAKQNSVALLIVENGQIITEIIPV